MMGEVIENQQDVAVRYYDYQKAYDMVHHDLMMKVNE